ncbi:MAG: prolipoprotein diacylglyceryl transferase [Anaerovoracaceae bacterium]
MPNPIAFTLFNIEIRWYGVLIALGILLAIIIVYKRAPKHQIDPDSLLDVLLVSIPFGIIGARLYYVVFNWSYYSGDFGEIINLRNGGLAIHGGLIFAFIAAFFMCKHKKIDFINGLDLVIPAVALAQSIGRWGNYFNGEAHGRPTDLPWAITVMGTKVHPTFLYESLWCLGLFFLLTYLDNHREFKGQIILLYGVLYSIERFFVEGLRTDSLMIGPFRQAQVLSIVVIIICSILYFIFNKNKQKEFNK